MSQQALASGTQAVKQAIHSARKCRGAAHVVVQEPQFRWRIEWSSPADTRRCNVTQAELEQVMPPQPVAEAQRQERRLIAE